MPFAFIGGVLALYFRGMNLNVSTGVGFAALFGVSIMNGVLMVRSITRLAADGMATGRGHHSRGTGLLAADPAGVARGDSGLAAGVAGDGPGLRRATAAGDGDRLGIVEFDHPDAIGRADCLSPLSARICARPSQARHYLSRGDWNHFPTHPRPRLSAYSSIFGSAGVKAR